MSLRVLVVGSGGREHALAWRLAQSPIVDRIFVCPGNGGTAHERKTANVDISATDFPALAHFAVANDVRPIYPAHRFPIHISQLKDQPCSPWTRATSRRWYRTALPQR